MDVIDFAVGTQKFNDDTLNEVRIASFLTTRIYKDSGFFYDERGDSHHTIVEDKKGRRMRLQVSNFLSYPGNEENDPKANCQDLSNLFQVCTAALGTRSFEVRRVDGPFRFRRVWPAGFADWLSPEGMILLFHQTGFSTEAGTIFDPTYQLDNGGQPHLPINMTPGDYRTLLQDQSQKPKVERANPSPTFGGILTASWPRESANFGVCLELLPSCWYWGMSSGLMPKSQWNRA